MGTLYDITTDYRCLLEFADSVDPDDERVFNDTLDSVLATLDIKMDDYAVVLTHMEADIELLEKEKGRIQSRIDALERNRKRMRENLMGAMILTNQRKVNTGRFRLSVQKNGGKLPLVVDGDVPDSFKRVVLEVDKERIRKALDDGEALDFAHYGERGEHLVIR